MRKLPENNELRKPVRKYILAGFDRTATEAVVFSDPASVLEHGSRYTRCRRPRALNSNHRSLVCRNP
jgi:hypothetical protein